MLDDDLGFGVGFWVKIDAEPSSGVAPDGTGGLVLALLCDLDIFIEPLFAELFIDERFEQHLGRHIYRLADADFKILPFLPSLLEAAIPFIGCGEQILVPLPKRFQAVDARNEIENIGVRHLLSAQGVEMAEPLFHRRSSLGDNEFVCDYRSLFLLGHFISKCNSTTKIYAYS